MHSSWHTMPCEQGPPSLLTPLRPYSCPMGTAVPLRSLPWRGILCHGGAHWGCWGGRAPSAADTHSTLLPAQPHRLRGGQRGLPAWRVFSSSAGLDSSTTKGLQPCRHAQLVSGKWTKSFLARFKIHKYSKHSKWRRKCLPCPFEYLPDKSTPMKDGENPFSNS